jgi:hypothetical protein
MDNAQEVSLKMLKDLQKNYPDLTPELAMKTFLVESLKCCKDVFDLTKLPVDPSVLNQLLKDGLIDQLEYSRIMQMLDPSQK